MVGVSSCSSLEAAAVGGFREEVACVSNDIIIRGTFCYLSTRTPRSVGW